MESISINGYKNRLCDIFSMMIFKKYFNYVNISYLILVVNIYIYIYIIFSMDDQ